MNPYCRDGKFYFCSRPYKTYNDALHGLLRHCAAQPTWKTPFRRLWAKIVEFYYDTRGAS